MLVVQLRELAWIQLRDPRGRELMGARFDLGVTQPEWALGYTWDIVLGRGVRATPLDAD